MVTFGAADYLSASNGPSWLKIVPKYLARPAIDPGDLCSENRGVLGFNLIWLTDKGRWGVGGWLTDRDEWGEGASLRRLAAT